MGKQLSPQQQRFVDEYMGDFNAGQAAIRAGYSPNDTSIGSKMVNHPGILDAIRLRMMAMQERLEITADMVVNGFARIAWDPRSAQEGGPTYGDRTAALREIGKLLGLYISKLQISGTLTLEQLLLQVDAQDKLPAVQRALPKPDASH